MTDDTPVLPARGTAAPRIGFVSLGCPKALTDSELILTQLSAEGYRTSKTFEGADLVIVTGCLGARAGDKGDNLVREMHPSVLAVTGPHATQEVMDAVHAHLPKPHDPFVDLMPAAGTTPT